MQKGAIAGSKLLKFYEHLDDSLKKYFDIKEKEFYYRNEQNAVVFVGKGKEGLVIKGPPINKIEETKKFKEKHKKTFVKNKIIYAKEETRSNFRDFIILWKEKNKEIIKNMYIADVKIVD